MNIRRSDILRRVALATDQARKHRRYLFNRRFSYASKARLLNTFVQPVLLYGAPTWRDIGENRRLLETFWNRQARKVIGVTTRDRIKTENVLKTSGLLDIHSTWMARRHEYYGHVLRAPKDWLVHKWLRASVEMPKASRRSGRPRLKDQMEKQAEAAGLCEKDAHDRLKWANTVRKEVGLPLKRAAGGGGGREGGGGARAVGSGAGEAPEPARKPGPPDAKNNEYRASAERIKYIEEQQVIAIKGNKLFLSGGEELRVTLWDFCENSGRDEAAIEGWRFALEGRKSVMPTKLKWIM